jgi:metal-dependent amidase/aminoacylase/carboxypeptidase family protein
MSTLKDAIAAAVDRLGGDLENLSHRIHAHPELGYQEVKAAAWLAEFLDAQGFTVSVASGASTASGDARDRRGPDIGSQYDALPQIGHARPQHHRDRGGAAPACCRARQV